MLKRWMLGRWREGEEKKNESCWEIEVRVGEDLEKRREKRKSA